MSTNKGRLLIGAGCLLGVLGLLAVLETSRPVAREASKVADASVAAEMSGPDRTPGVVDVTLNPRAASYTQRDQTSNRDLMARFADAVSLPRLETGTEDELRVLYQFADFGETTVGVSLEGHVVRNGTISTCDASFGKTLEDPLTGKCKKPRALGSGSTLTDLSGLSSLSGRDYFCGVVDGYWVTIEGRHEGRYFILSASNPDQCDNEGSKLIAQMLAGL